MMKFLFGLSLMLLLLSACEKERETARATGEIPQQTIDNTVKKMNELNAIADQKLRANADTEPSNADTNTEAK